MAKNFTLDSHVLEDEIVLDGIRAVNQMKRESGVRGYISGGMAVSSYLPEETHRHTIDLDFNLYWGGKTKEFWDIATPLVRTLTEIGYGVTSKRQNATFDFVYSKDGKTFMAQHQRRSRANFEKNKSSFEREIENMRFVTKGDLSYEIISPEDLMTRKLSRMYKFSYQHGLSFPQLRSLPELKKHIEREKKALIDSPDKDFRDIIHLRMEHDLYDIKRLGNYVGVNMDYLKESAAAWTEEPIKYLEDFMRIWKTEVVVPEDQDLQQSFDFGGAES